MDRCDIEKILKKQRNFFDSGTTLDIRFRKAALKKLHDAMTRYEDRLLAALKKDLGKSSMEAYMSEVGLAKAEISHMIKHVSSYAAERNVHTPLSQYVSRSFVKPEPYGNALIMSPWNYPVLLSIDSLADAMAAGNTVILKPSAYAANTSKVLAEMIGDIFPKKYVSVITGGRKENAELLDLKFDIIFFTGSKQVGIEVLRKSADKLTPVILELGGKSPCIVDETADIMLAARRIVFGKFLNCGQTCVAPDYICCAESVKEELIAAIKSEITRQYGESPIHNENYGKIINEKHFDRISGLIEAARLRRKAGGDPSRIKIWGGELLREELKIAPAIIEDADFLDAAMGEEIFGPVLPVISYKSLNETAEKINQRERPLALYIFSKDKANIDFVKNKIRYGGGCINDTVIHIATSSMGFGGAGESGMGAYHGRTGFDAFSHKKSIVDKKLFLDLPMRYQPYNAVNNGLIRWLLK